MISVFCFVAGKVERRCEQDASCVLGREQAASQRIRGCGRGSAVAEIGRTLADINPPDPRAYSQGKRDG